MSALQPAQLIAFQSCALFFVRFFSFIMSSTLAALCYGVILLYDIKVVNCFILFGSNLIQNNNKLTQCIRFIFIKLDSKSKQSQLKILLHLFESLEEDGVCVCKFVIEREYTTHNEIAFSQGFTNFKIKFEYASSLHDIDTISQVKHTHTHTHRLNMFGLSHGKSKPNVGVIVLV